MKNLSALFQNSSYLWENEANEPELTVALVLVGAVSAIGDPIAPGQVGHAGRRLRPLAGELSPLADGLIAPRFVQAVRAVEDAVTSGGLGTATAVTALEVTRRRVRRWRHRCCGFFIVNNVFDFVVCQAKVLVRRYGPLPVPALIIPGLYCRKNCYWAVKWSNMYYLYLSRNANCTHIHKKSVYPKKNLINQNSVK